MTIRNNTRPQRTLGKGTTFGGYNGKSRIRADDMGVAKFYPVRIYSPDGKLKEEISTEQLRDRYWDKFKKGQGGGMAKVQANSMREKTKRGIIQKQLNVMFVSPYPLFND